MVNDMKTFIKVLKGFFGLLIVLTVLLVFVNVYGFIYKEFNQTNFAFLMDYTTYDVIENNMEPKYTLKDVIILKRDYTYGIDDIVVCDYKGSYRLGKINDVSGGAYIINDSVNSFDESFKIGDEQIIGKVAYHLKGFKGIKNVLSSTYSLIILTIFVIAYAVFEVKSNGNR